MERGRRTSKAIKPYIGLNVKKCDTLNINLRFVSNTLGSRYSATTLILAVLRADYSLTAEMQLPMYFTLEIST